MLLRDIHTQFKNTIPICDGFFKLMQDTFGFYTTLCNDFFSKLGIHIEENSLGNFLQNEIRPRLFEKEHCKAIEKTKKQFLAENIKLEQFIREHNFKQDFINDLTALKKVSDAMYELLQTHWEFFKYEKSIASNEVLVAFILEIDRVGIRWDSYLEKYLAISSILKEAGGEIQKDGFTSILVQYHFPDDLDFTAEMVTSLIRFLQVTFEFIANLHKNPKETLQFNISNLIVRNPVNCMLIVPNCYVESYQKFLGYLSVDVLKRETLLKFVMEVLRLRQGKEIPKTSLSNFQKKIAKHLNALPQDGFLSVDNNEAEDSVNLMSVLCQEMDRLKIEYKDMLTGATDRLARNRKQSLSRITSVAVLTSHLSEKNHTKNRNDQPLSSNHKKTQMTEKKNPKDSSTVKIDVKNKEHIQYLTSS